MSNPLNMADANTVIGKFQQDVLACQRKRVGADTFLLCLPPSTQDYEAAAVLAVAVERERERERERCAAICDRRREEAVPVVIDASKDRVGAKIDEAVFFALAYAAQEIRGAK